jgi:hypothetical protein
MKTLKKQLREAPLSRSQKVSDATSAPPFNTQSLAQNPDSNTGLNSQNGFSIGLDWLDITFRQVPDMDELERILSEAEALFNDEIDFSPTRATFNGREWQGSGRGAQGTLVFWDSGIDQRGERRSTPMLKLCFSGRLMASANQPAVAHWLFGRRESNELDCSRIDIALDDHDKVVPLWKITQAKDEGNFFNALYYGYHESGKRGQDKGIAVYFGSPASTKRLCVYDKSVESKGRIQGNRWEGRFRKKAAKVVLYQWIDKSLENENSCTRWCADIITGIIDFRDRTSNDPNRFRCKVLDWFSDFIIQLKASPIRVRIAAVAMTVQRSLDWVVKSVAPSLSLIKSVLLEDYSEFIQTTIYEGGVRLSLQKRKLIDTTDRSLLLY